MIVVSNTSPITNLAAIGQFRLLPAIFEKIYIAEGVWKELNAYGKHWPGRDEVANSNSFEVRKVHNQSLVLSLQSDLDQGEAETIALALQTKAPLVLMDEREGRRAAERLGLDTVGVIGLLLKAKGQGEIPEIRAQLNALRHVAGFYIGDQLYHQVLETAGEISENNT